MYSAYPWVSCEGDIIPGLNPAAAAMAARFAPPSPAGDTRNCPVDVAMVDPVSVVLTSSCFALDRVAVAEGVSDKDVTGGAGVATAGAKEMTVAVFEVTGPRVVPEVNRKSSTGRNTQKVSVLILSTKQCIEAPTGRPQSLMLGHQFLENLLNPGFSVQSTGVMCFPK